MKRRKQILGNIGEDLLLVAKDQPFRFPATFTFVVRGFSPRAHPQLTSRSAAGPLGGGAAEQRREAEAVPQPRAPDRDATSAEPATVRAVSMRYVGVRFSSVARCPFETLSELDAISSACCGMGEGQPTPAARCSSLLPLKTPPSHHRVQPP